MVGVVVASAARRRRVRVRGAAQRVRRRDRCAAHRQHGGVPDRQRCVGHGAGDHAPMRCVPALAAAGLPTGAGRTRRVGGACRRVGAVRRHARRAGRRPRFRRRRCPTRCGGPPARRPGQPARHRGSVARRRRNTPTSRSLADSGRALARSQGVQHHERVLHPQPRHAERCRAIVAEAAGRAAANARHRGRDPPGRRRRSIERLGEEWEWEDTPEFWLVEVDSLAEAVDSVQPLQPALRGLADQRRPATSTIGSTQRSTHRSSATASPGGSTGSSRSTNRSWGCRTGRQGACSRGVACCRVIRSTPCGLRAEVRDHSVAPLTVVSLAVHRRRGGLDHGRLPGTTSRMATSPDVVSTEARSQQHRRDPRRRLPSTRLTVAHRLDGPSTDATDSLPPLFPTIPRPGARLDDNGIGDALFPSLGNPGIDVEHYTLEAPLRPRARRDHGNRSPRHRDDRGLATTFSLDSDGPIVSAVRSTECQPSSRPSPRAVDHAGDARSPRRADRRRGRVTAWRPQPAQSAAGDQVGWFNDTGRLVRAQRAGGCTHVAALQRPSERQGHVPVRAHGAVGSHGGCQRRAGRRTPRRIPPTRGSGRRTVRWRRT